MDFKVKKVVSKFPVEGKPDVSVLQQFFDDPIPSPKAVKLVKDARRKARKQKAGNRK